MSHNPERADRTCLNCGNQVVGRFCHACGQENIETKESFWSLIKHFVYDIIHFDGKFFHTLSAIFRQPGLVARRYAEGKRASYLHPIRMYLFTSAIFFLVFFSVGKLSTSDRSFITIQINNEDRKRLAAELQGLLIISPNDTMLKRSMAELLDTTKVLNLESIGRINNYTTSIGVSGSLAAIKKYDSVQNSLPQANRDGWMKRRFKMMKYKVSPVYNGTRGIEVIRETLLHRLPYMLFVSLPFFALLLKLLYIRRKNFYYNDHATFTLFHYILSFILLLFYTGSNALLALTHWRIFAFFKSISLLVWMIYLFIEMKNFYKQGFLKTFGKFVLLNILSFLLLTILFILFSLVSALQV